MNSGQVKVNQKLDRFYDPKAMKMQPRSQGLSSSRPLLEAGRRETLGTRLMK